MRGVLTAAESAPHLIEKVVLSPDLLTSEKATDRLFELIPAGKIVEFAPSLFRSLSDRDNPTGLGAVVRSPLTTLESYPSPTSTSRYLILDLNFI